MSYSQSKSNLLNLSTHEKEQDDDIDNGNNLFIFFKIGKVLFYWPKVQVNKKGSKNPGNCANLRF